MFKTIGNVCKNLIIWLLPVCIILGLFANIQKIEHFNFLEWVQQLPDIMENPVVPLQVARSYIIQVFNTNPVNSILDIVPLLKNIFSCIYFVSGCIGKCLLAVFNDILNFIKWISLGYY